MTAKSRPSAWLKYGVAATLLAVYAVVSAWLVASEGEAYRQAIAAKAIEVPPAVVASQAPPAPDDFLAPVSKPTSLPPVVKEVVEAKPRQVAALEPNPRPSIPKPETLKTADPPPATTKTESPAKLPVDPYWEEPAQKKVWNLDELSLEDEKQLGLALNRTIRRYHKALDVGPLPKRLEDAAEPYLKTVARKDLKYTFTVLDCPRMNVFSHPGGYIYVCKGLFDWIAEDEDYALGFAIAHEMAHVDLGHAITCLRDSEVKKLNLATVPLFFIVAIPGGYLEAMDFEADRWAVTRMLKAGRTRYESLAFLRRLEDYARSHEFENDPPKKPNDDPKIPWLDNHIRAHPIPRKRLKELKAVIDPLLKT